MEGQGFRQMSTAERFQYLAMHKPYEKKREEDELNDDEEWRLPIDHQPTGYIDESQLMQASMDTAISSNNIGYKLLQKMGWKGKGLGRDGEGIIDPIRIELKEDFMGLGKREQDDEYATRSATKRKALEIEKEETEESKKKKQELHAKEENRKQEIAEINKPFYCQLCSKQYTNVAQYDQHLSSYDHHHKKRLADMRQMDRAAKRGVTATKKRKTKTTKEKKKPTEPAAPPDANAATATTYPSIQPPPSLPGQPPLPPSQSPLPSAFPPYHSTPYPSQPLPPGYHQQQPPSPYPSQPPPPPPPGFPSYHSTPYPSQPLPPGYQQPPPPTHPPQPPPPGYRQPPPPPMSQQPPPPGSSQPPPPSL